MYGLQSLAPAPSGLVWAIGRCGPPIGKDEHLAWPRAGSKIALAAFCTRDGTSATQYCNTAAEFTTSGGDGGDGSPAAGGTDTASSNYVQAKVRTCELASSSRTQPHKSVVLALSPTTRNLASYCNIAILQYCNTIFSRGSLRWCCCNHRHRHRRHSWSCAASPPSPPLVVVLAPSLGE